MLIIRKNQTNNLIATVSMNKTLANPYYLFSFQHIASKERISFIPQVITSNVRYDKFRFVEAPTTNLNVTPPEVFFEYIGQYYYSIYEQISSGNTDPSLAYNKLESGRAWVIVGNDDLLNCLYEPYISNDEDFAQVIYVSEEEEQCINPPVTPSMTPTPSTTPNVTPTNTPSMTPTPSPTPPPPNPNTYNAIWWLDYSNSQYVTVSGNDLLGVVNRTGNPDFSGKTGQYTHWDPLGYNGISGASKTINGGLTSLKGDYSSMSAYTHFLVFKGEDGSNATFNQSENITVDYSGNTQNYRWFSLDDYTPSPPNFVRTYTFYTDGSAVVPEPQFNYTGNTWYNAAVRVYQTGADATTELWLDGNLVSSTTQTKTIITAIDPIFNVCFGGTNNVRVAEQFFFNYNLNNTQMGDMFNYLSNKY